MKPAEFLPAGWKFHRFGEIARFNRELFRVEPTASYRELSLRLYGNGFDLRREVAGASLVADEMQRLKMGQLVTSIHQFRNGAVGIVTREFDGAVLSKNFLVYDLDQAVVDPSFLVRFLAAPSSVSFFQANSTGSATPIFPKVMIENVEIPLPPLEEQRRVVARIDELAAEINEARTLRHQAAEEAETLLHASLRRIRNRLLNSTHPKAQLGQVTRVTSGGTPSRSNPAFWDGDIPWVKTGELIDGDISNAEEHITQTGVENSSAKVFPVETILVALYGQGQTRGRTGRLMIPAATNQACCAILPNPEKFIAHYVQFWLRSLYVELREEAQGGAQPNWNGAMIKELEVAFPPLPVQRRIVAELDALQAEVASLKSLQAETAAELDALLPSVLDKAFRGKL